MELYLIISKVMSKKIGIVSEGVSDFWVLRHIITRYLKDQDLWILPLNPKQTKDGKQEEILNNSEIPDNMKIAVINMVLERVYGKPEEMLRIASGERNSAEAAERLRQAARRAAAREEQ